MNTLRRLRCLGWTALAALTAGACSDATGGDTQVTVLLTDAAHQYLSSATVTIGEIALIPAGGPPVVLTDVGGTHELYELQNGATANLASMEIAAGTYLQLRMVVNSASVALDGLEFNDGTATRELDMPSGALSGIKINLRGEEGAGAGVTITPGENVLVVDFDVSQNFVIQGNPDAPAGLSDVLFTPLLRAVVEDVAGSIAGTVRNAEGTGLPDVTVRATPKPSGTDATAITGSDGTYTILFLAPGTYDVSPDGSVAVTEVTVGEGESVTEVDFVI